MPINLSFWEFEQNFDEVIDDVHDNGREYVITTESGGKVLLTQVTDDTLVDLQQQSDGTA